MGEEGGGGRRKRKEGRKNPNISNPLLSNTLHPATSRPHALPPVSVDERRCRALDTE